MTSKSPKIALVVAVADNDVIGRDKAIPWRVRADLVRLKTLTKDQVVLLGRKTYESMDKYYLGTGRQMPGRLYIVLTHDTNFRASRANATVAHSWAEALDKAGSAQIFVIGGARLFEEALPSADRVYLTRVKATVQGDTYMPPLDMKQWQETEREDHPADERNEYPYSFVNLVRKHH